MNKDTQAALSTLGTGLAAGAAGYGASAAMGGDKTTSIMTGTASGLLASLLAHLITNKTIKEQQPLVNKGVAASAGTLAGGATALGTLGGLAYVDDKIGNKISPAISNFLRDAGYSKYLKKIHLQDGSTQVVDALFPKSGKLAPLARELYKYHTQLNNSINTMGIGDKASKMGKLFGPLLRNKKGAVSALAGLTAIPLTYKALRGNGSD